jgi:hypothetical protein
MLGRSVHPDEPLMAAGLDSRGGMELRRTLADSLGMQVGAKLEGSVDPQSFPSVRFRAPAPCLHNSPRHHCLSWKD